MVENVLEQDAQSRQFPQGDYTLRRHRRLLVTSIFSLHTTLLIHILFCPLVTGLDTTRKNIKDFTFSDGRLVLKGTRINAGIIALHHDDALYEKPGRYLIRSGLRSWVRRTRRAQSISSLRLLPSTCRLDKADTPGMAGSHRPLFILVLIFFVYSLLAPAVSLPELRWRRCWPISSRCTISIKPEENTTRPQSLHIWSWIGADSTAKVMFRKRARYGGAQGWAGFLDDMRFTPRTGLGLCVDANASLLPHIHTEHHRHSH